MTADKEGRMTLADLIFVTFTVLLGQEGRDYLVHRREPKEWLLIQWLRRN